jgi:Gram-negative bacterial TonB protein C-terminal
MSFFLGILAFAGLSGVGSGSQVDPLSKIVVTRAVAPPYPESAIRSAAEGLVVVLVSIDKHGLVTKASLVSQTAPPELFPAKTFENAAKGWRFDVPEPMDVDLVFAFQLLDEEDDVDPATTFDPPTTVTVRALREPSRASQGK